MGRKKAVGILLRVSTNTQANLVNNEADIPTQRTACMRFIAQHPQWELVKEYMEVGVSGYKNSMEQRDKLLEIQEDIATGHIDVLVVFMFDRLGRIEEETPFVVKSFVDMGCEVWSVQEGQRKFEDHVDSLLNYITFWQASGESKKTSQRVTNTMNQMAEAGHHTGGRPPYGYKTVETGGVTKKRLPEKRLVADEDEAVVVRLIYQLAIQKDYGCHRIAEHLNHSGIPTRSGKQWGHSVIANILSNPVYKGYRCYNRTTAKGGKSQKRMPRENWIVAPFSPELAIIPEREWALLQKKRKLRADKQQQQKRANDSIVGYDTVKSKLLLAGIAHCGVCGGKMYTGYSPYRWKTKDGAVHRKHNPVYRCGRQSTGRVGCTGQLSYRPDTFEPVVLRAIHTHLDALEQIDLTANLRRLSRDRVRAEEKALRDLNKKSGQLGKELNALKGRYLKLITEKDSPEEERLLLRLIQDKGAELDAVSAQRQQAEDRYTKRIAQIDEAMAVRHTTPIWRALFDKADSDTKKVVIRELISRVDLNKDCVEIEFCLSLHDFFSQLPGRESNRVTHPPQESKSPVAANTANPKKPQWG